MFFVTLLLERGGRLDARAVGHVAACARSSTWTRSSASSRRSPSRPRSAPLLTLLKQARAFGLGVVLATQNPVDLDYKGLSNAGTWLIGRLQTERDKQRLLDGLEGAAATARVRPRRRRSTTIAGLGKRVFLMNNVHETAPVVFEYALGAVVPARAADARPDPDADGRPRRARRAAGARRRRAAPPPPRRGSRRRRRPRAAAPAPAAPAIPPDVPRYYVPLPRHRPGGRLAALRADGDRQRQRCALGTVELRAGRCSRRSRTAP